MKRNLIFVLMLFFLSASFILAGGFSIYEHGAKATAMAGAFAAQADDPSAFFYNPAGIAFQKRSLYLNTTIIHPDSDFYGANPYPGEGIHEEQESRTFLPSDLYLILPANENLVFGIGVYTPFGLSTKWYPPETFSGRYIATKTTVQSFRIQPTIAYTPNDRFAVALGINYLEAKAYTEKYIPAVNPYTNRVVDVGHVRFDGGYDGAWGYDLGLILKPIPGISFGFTYHSEEDVDFSGRAFFEQIPTGYADFDALVAQKIPFNQELGGSATINFPEQAMFGVATTLIPKCTIEFDVGYIGWSSYDSLPITVVGHPELSVVRPTDWDDSYSYRLGFQYQVNDNFALRCGYEYDETPQPAKEVSPILPDADRNGYCFGFGYTSGSMTLDFGYMYLDFDERSTVGVTDQLDQFFGVYDTTAHLISFSLKYNF